MLVRCGLGKHTCHCKARPPVLGEFVSAEGLLAAGPAGLAAALPASLRLWHRAQELRAQLAHTTHPHRSHPVHKSYAVLVLLSPGIILRRCR